MNHIFEFGISQDDALTEKRALDLGPGDKLLCVASAGEVPLNLLALNDISIHAVDISLNQLFLAKLKLHAVQSLDPLEAAGLLGFMESGHEERLIYFDKLKQMMEEDEISFWQNHQMAIINGPIHEARFEKYIARFSKIGLGIIGKKKIVGLFDCGTVEQQRDYFDRHLSNWALKLIFKIAFHPSIYKNRGLSSEGLIHSGERNIAKFFYSRFRDFCCGTLARHNYYLQFSFFNQVLFTEALPEYLSEKGVLRIRNNSINLLFSHQSYYQAVKQSKDGEFNKFALSNIIDWMDNSEFSNLLLLIKEKACSPSRLLSRYIHYNYPIAGDLAKYFFPDYNSGDLLVHLDRYPFYSLVPIDFKRQDYKVSNSEPELS